MFGRPHRYLRVAVVPGSPVRFASWHPWNTRWLQRWGTPLGCWGSPDQRSFHFVFGDHHHNYAGKMLETMKLYIYYISIYITWNTVIKYAIIIDVVHVHNILILDICIWNHQAVFGVYQCISYTDIYKICLDLALICHECHPIHLTTRRTAWSLVSWEVWKIWRLCCQ